MTGAHRGRVFGPLDVALALALEFLAFPSTDFVPKPPSGVLRAIDPPSGFLVTGEGPSEQVLASSF